MDKTIKDFMKSTMNHHKKLAQFLLLAFILVFTGGCVDTEVQDSSSMIEEDTEEVAEESLKQKESEKNDKAEEVLQEEKQVSAGHMKVHYINVGQGDSTLIQLPNGKIVLIDGATRSNGQTVLDYLNNLNIEKIDYLIATHPHEDHIGGLVNVVKKYEIGKIYMPDKAHTTIVFEDLLLAIQEKGYSIIKAEAGDMLFEEDGLSMSILAPSGISGSNLNNYSVANRLVFGDTSFVFTGDAEKTSEENMINSRYDLTADVLKIGHHGGDTSTIEPFLVAVQPTYGVISAGEDNQYGHPHQNVLDRLADYGVEIFRTDRDGTIIASSDGKTIEFNQKSTSITKTPSNSFASEDQIEVYRTDTGTKYHRGDCHTLKHSKVAIPLNEAIEEGLEPCGICKPAE